jgi:FkbM family methyltransferase
VIEELNLEFRKSEKWGGEWLWPVEDFWGWKNLNKKPNRELPDKILSFVTEKSLLIQAGGNCGLYPKYYAKHFKKILTFEPDYRNFSCLTYNVPEKNVYKFQCCLGEDNKPVSLTEHEIFHGLASLYVSGSGDIPQITIDSLNVNPTLIHLDIEGFEGFALLGAKETINRSKPIIALETNGLGDNVGWSKEKINDLLFSWNYKILLDIGHDTIYGINE